MQYLVQMRLSSSARPASDQDGIALIEQCILHTLELCKKLQEEIKILAGGPMSGAIVLIQSIPAVFNFQQGWDLFPISRLVITGLVRPVPRLIPRQLPALPFTHPLFDLRGLCGFARGSGPLFS
jgi:hypothetical protein